jgi:hypothetical protein
MDEIIDLTADTPSSVYSGRAGHAIIQLVLHDTAGSEKNPDKNDLPLSVEGFRARERATIRWFQGGGGLSIHYLIGPEKTGAPIYRLCREEFAAYHVGGNPEWGFPARWRDPVTGAMWEGARNGIGALNVISIGIERWGFPNEKVGPFQTRAMLTLCQDIASRHNLVPERIVAHRELQGNRTDGGAMLEQVRQAVRNMRQGQPVPKPQPPDNTDPFGDPGAWHCVMPGLDYWVTDEFKFLSTWRNNGSIGAFGYPVSGAYQRGDFVYQWFQRARFEYNLKTRQITFGLVGAELYDLLGRPGG